MVRCCRTYEEVCEGDVGKVIKLDRDGLHDLNVQCDWQQKGGTYWVRYIHVELLGEFSSDCFLSKKVNVRLREMYFWRGKPHSLYIYSRIRQDSRHRALPLISRSVTKCV